MSVATASASATLTADEIIVETALGGIRYCLSGFNKTINLATTGAGGMDTGSAPNNGFVALYAIYNPTSGSSALLAVSVSGPAVPNIYGGANMPTGYTASALVSVWPTNGSGQFVVGIQGDRTVGLAPTLQLNTGTQQTSLTALTVTTGVPPNAKAVYGEVSVQTTSISAMACSVASSTNNLMESNIANQNAVQIRTVFQRTLLVTPQTLYYTASVGAGTMTFQLWTTGYDF
ncbi:phage tail protein [Ralstonia pseudosolanacearum]|nr:phage tail protein [Ralstonia pseudosolanacearum]